MSNSKTNQFIALTGAGFTKNFNGFLASEMWAKIFNDTRIQNCEKIRSILRDDDNFESAYSRVLTSKEYSDDEKQIMKQVIEDIYKSLDDAIRNWRFNHNNPTALDTYKLWSELLSLFNGSSGKTGLFFTLNQDLYIERSKGWVTPGAPRFNQDFYSLSGREFKNTDWVMIPQENVQDKIKKDINGNSGINYIKLHGSFGWRTAEGLNQMVIGRNKEDDIKNEPLLKAYFDMFESTIAEGDKKLLIIGYGFGDQHINKVLVGGVTKYRLKIFIITTTTWQNFNSSLRNGHYYAMSIKDGVRGYFPYRLREIFPPDQGGSVYIGEIKNALLNN